MTHSDSNKYKAIEAGDDVVEDFEFDVDEGGAPLHFIEDEILYDDDREMELFETAMTAKDAALDLVDDDAEWQGYTAEEEEEVRALVIGHLVAYEAQRAYTEAGNDPSAAAHAVLRLLIKTQEAIVEQIGQRAFPTLSVGGDEELVDPT